MPVGICFWLRCSPSGCSVRTSLKVGHYQPDAVVSSYNELGGNPWVEIRNSLGVAQKGRLEGCWVAYSPCRLTVPATERRVGALTRITATWSSGKRM
ncbi:MAG: TraU family protein [Halioglobus sp.]